MVDTDNGVSLDFAGAHGDITPQHYAFLISESESDDILARIRERDLPLLGRSGTVPAGELNHPDRGCGVYVEGEANFGEITSAIATALDLPGPQPIDIDAAIAEWGYEPAVYALGSNSRVRSRPPPTSPGSRSTAPSSTGSYKERSRDRMAWR